MVLLATLEFQFCLSGFANDIEGIFILSECYFRYCFIIFVVILVGRVLAHVNDLLGFGIAGDFDYVVIVVVGFIIEFIVVVHFLVEIFVANRRFAKTSMSLSELSESGSGLRSFKAFFLYLKTLAVRTSELSESLIVALCLLVCLCTLFVE